MPDIFIKIPKNNCSCQFILEGEQKFYADTFIYENDEFNLLLNGFLFNFKELDIKRNFEWFVNGFKEKSINIIKDLRGSFCGAICNKLTNETFAFTNQIGDHPLYYSETNKYILISSDIYKLVKELRKRSTTLNLNLKAAYALLSYGYFIEEMTLISEIKRIPAGHFLKITEGKVSLNTYYHISNTPNYSRSEDEIIEEMDFLFRNAVQYEFEKDKIYNLKHLSSISGGLDCRMSNWVANDLGYDEVTAYTFSQFGYLDMTIGHSIAIYLGYDWIFKSLDQGNYLENIDEMVKITNAQINYFGSAHANSTFNILDFSDFGILHTGQLGDVTIGTYSPKHAYSKQIKVKATSYRFIDKVQTSLKNFENNEIANYRVRGLNGILSGNLVAQAYTEVASPFLDVDFLNFCFSIPVEKRAYHRIYKKWILQKYSEAAQFKWESINAKLTNKTLVIRGKIIPVKEIFKFICEGLMYQLGHPINATFSKKNMNPYNYWYKTNSDLRVKFDDYFNTHLDIITNKELKSDCISQFIKGSAVEKMQVLTLLSAMKQFNL